LETKRVKKDLDDNWVWLGDTNGIYSVRNAYSRIRNDMMGDDDELFYKQWTAKALPSTQFYAWRVMLDRVLTAVRVSQGLTVCVSFVKIRKTPLVTYCAHVKRSRRFGTFAMCGLVCNLSTTVGLRNISLALKFHPLMLNVILCGNQFG